MAIAPQTPWIMHNTLRENITFGEVYDAGWYNEVILACGLTPDLTALKYRDLTQIGERVGEHTRW